MSPHPLLVGAVQELARDAGADRLLAVGSVRRNEDEHETILGSLAQLYVRGHAIEWSTLCARDARPIATPAYRWMRDRFWYDAPGAPAGAKVARRSDRRGPGQAIASAVHAGTFLWDFELSLADWPELRDHQVHGAVVLPAAAYIVFARTCAAQVLRSSTIRLESLTIDSVLTLSESAPSHLQIVGRLGADGSADFEILSADAGQTEPGGSATWLRHAACRASVAAAAPEGPARLDAAERDERGEQHYERMSARGLVYGPAYRTVEDVRFDGCHAEGRLRHRESPLGPEPIDGALQIVLGLAPEQCRAGATYVPVAVSEIVFTGASPAAGDLICNATLTESADATRFGGDAAVRDINGSVLMFLRGVRFQLAGGHDRVGTGFYRITWTAEPLAASSSGQSASGSWLIVPDASALGTHLAAAIEARGGTAIVSSRSGLDTTAAYRDVIDAATSAGRLRGIIYLPARDIEMGVRGDEAARSCLGPLALAQAVAAAGVSLDGGIAFITSGAQRLAASDASLSLGQAPVWGFNATLRAEHPELRSACIDVDVQPDPAEIAGLVDELIAGLPADRVAFRHGVRRVARLSATEVSNAMVSRDQPRSASSADRPFRVAIPRPGVLEGFEAARLVRRSPAAHEVEIEVHATSLNFMNVMSAMGMYPGYPNGVGPLGIECAGRVSAVGAGVQHIAIGDEVMAIAFDCLASHAIADARLVAQRPASLSVEQAASVPIVFLTAWYALQRLAGISAGDRVLIHSAAGGVGLAALQLARRAGAEVYATAGTDAKRDWLRSLGVRHVFDSRSTQFAADVMAATDGAGVDIVLNSLAGDAIARACRCCAHAAGSSRSASATSTRTVRSACCRSSAISRTSRSISIGCAASVPLSSARCSPRSSISSSAASSSRCRSGRSR